MLDSDNVAISVNNVHKSFRLPHEKFTGLKQAVIHFRPGKKYQKIKVLKGISFEIKKGEFFGIVGRNGSGKSTLLKILASIYTPEQGGVQINGSLTPFIELGVGFNPELTGRENVYLNGALLGFNRKQTEAMYDEIVEFAELRAFMDQKLKNYSSGMQVRLAFSVAIRAKSDILLIDEVLAVGDGAFQQKCFNYFEKIKHDGQTLVLVTHDMSAVNRFCDRALIIENGKIKKIGKPTDVADVYIIDNLESAQKAREVEEEDDSTSGKYSIDASISERPGKVVLDVSYGSKNKEQMYVGISIHRNGISFAEITTSLERPLVRNGKVSYVLDPSILNGGLYEISIALFRLKNRERLAYKKKRLPFVVKGNDITKGAALKLPDAWEY